MLHAHKGCSQFARICVVVTVYFMALPVDATRRLSRLTSPQISRYTFWWACGPKTNQLLMPGLPGSERISECRGGLGNLEKLRPATPGPARQSQAGPNIFRASEVSLLISELQFHGLPCQHDSGTHYVFVESSGHNHPDVQFVLQSANFSAGSSDRGLYFQCSSWAQAPSHIHSP